VRQKHLRVGRTARYYMLGERTAESAWMVCHGYSQLARYFLRGFQSLADGTRCFIAPEALNRYYSETAPGVHAADARVGATWMTREDRDAEIADYIAYLDDIAALELRPEQRLVALGFSQGAATVSRWAARSSRRIHDVVLWGTGPAHDLPLGPDTFRGASVTLVAGDADEYFDVVAAERAATRLLDAGVECSVLAYAGGHRIVDSALAALARRLESR
jgi:predicted esterase